MSDGSAYLGHSHIINKKKKSDDPTHQGLLTAQCVGIAEKEIGAFISQCKLKQEAPQDITFNDCCDVGMKVTFILCSIFGVVTGYNLIQLCHLGTIPISNQAAYMISGTGWNTMDMTAGGKGLSDAAEGFSSGSTDAEGTLAFGRANYFWSIGVMGALTAFATVEVLMHGVAAMSVAALAAGTAGIVGAAMFLSGAAFVGAMTIAALQSNWEASVALKRAEDPRLLLESKIDECYVLNKTLESKQQERADLDSTPGNNKNFVRLKKFIKERKIKYLKREIEALTKKKEGLINDAAALSEMDEDSYSKVQERYADTVSIQNGVGVTRKAEGVEDIFKDIKTIKSDKSLRVNCMRAVRAERLILEQYKIAANKREDARSWTAAAVGTGVALAVFLPICFFMGLVSTTALAISCWYKGKQLKKGFVGRNRNDLATDEQRRDIYAEYKKTLNDKGELAGITDEKEVIEKVKEAIVKKFLEKKNIDVPDGSSLQKLGLSSDDISLIIDTECYLEAKNDKGEILYQQNNSLAPEQSEWVAKKSEQVGKKMNSSLSSAASFFGWKTEKGSEKVASVKKQEPKSN